MTFGFIGLALLVVVLLAIGFAVKAKASAELPAYPDAGVLPTMGAGQPAVTQPVATQPAAPAPATQTHADEILILNVDAPPQRVPELEAAVNHAVASAIAPGTLPDPQAIIGIAAQALSDLGVQLLRGQQGTELRVTLHGAPGVHSPMPHGLPMTKHTLSIALPDGVDPQQLSAIGPQLAQAVAQHPEVTTALSGGDNATATAAAEKLIADTLRAQGVIPADHPGHPGPHRVNINVSVATTTQRLS